MPTVTGSRIGMPCIYLESGGQEAMDSGIPFRYSQLGPPGDPTLWVGTLEDDFPKRRNQKYPTWARLLQNLVGLLLQSLSMHEKRLPWAGFEVAARRMWPKLDRPVTGPASQLR